MALSIQFSERNTLYPNQIFLISSDSLPAEAALLPDEEAYVNQQRQGAKKKDWIAINRYSGWIYIVFVKPEENASSRLEQCRRNAGNILGQLNASGTESACLNSFGAQTEEMLAFAEGMALANYQFLKYLKDSSEKQNSFKMLFVEQTPVLTAQMLSQLNIQIEATLWARDLVNEPLNKLNAVDLAQIISEKLRSVGGKAEIFNKKKIESLKMGGLLSVNLGSVDPPTFTILEWKPENAVNDQAVVLVGKGVVYDTGGMSLKPSNSMDTMKCDMSGSAAVAGAIYAAAKAKLPVYIIALVPATDNRVNGNAYVPGDIITMFDGTTVEVLNTDAEGRLILADALAYAKKFDPKLVINFATLTGAASRAIGHQGIVAMQVKAKEEFGQLSIAGDEVYERLVEFPMWDEYKEQIKSEIADLKNIGGPEAGMITAGKFLEHFTDYPFIHLDIAGPAFISKRDGYRSYGGTGVGVRLMFSFLNHMAEKK
jgi:leucyl aminopeptidase